MNPAKHSHEDHMSGVTKTTKKVKYSDIKLNYKIWLESDTGNGILGDGKWLLLKAIAKEGSLTAATEALNLSYRKTWNNLKKIEKMLGFPILEKTRGGKDGGSTALTAEGKKLVRTFDKFHSDFDEKINKAFEKFLKELTV
ncbi:MAG: LysR family transcriptional regulator [Bacteroidia bacterium]|nr:LysR family transcriptional regulator [Bacteroidia bacterium]